MKRVALIVCSAIGYLIGHYMGTGALAAYLSVLVSYHLYLGFLVMVQEKEAAPVLETGRVAALALAMARATEVGSFQARQLSICMKPLACRWISWLMLHETRP